MRRSALLAIEADLQELQRRRAGERVAVSVGRAAQMLRMSARQVQKYIHAGALQAERIEMPRRRRQTVAQFVLRKGEVHAFQRRLEDWRRRHPTRWSKQLALPLEAAPVKPALWRIRPVMLPGKVRDRELQGGENAKKNQHVA